MTSSKVFRALISLGTAGTATLAVTLFRPSEESPVKSEITKKPCTWDFNWDKREPSKLVSPKKLQKLLELGDQKDIDDLLKQNTPKASRHLFFIRHGQYNMEFKDDKLRKLTPLGREQAVYTGMRLRDLGHNYDSVVESSMTRAIETSELVRDQLPSIPLSRTDLLREGSPYAPEPPFSSWRPEVNVYTDNPRIESAFRKFVHRAEPSQEKDSYEVIVCHANVIRYIVCRAMQVYPEAWLRMSLKHGSITMMTVHPDGCVTVKCIGEAGHMPLDKLSS